MAEFDKDYWERHWDLARSTSVRQLAVNPYLTTETAHLPPGTALDAGCGTGTEALWLAQEGWEVTAADISRAALATARARAADTYADESIDWVETDLSQWEPEQTWDLVVTSYAHPEIGQLPFYRRIASWVGQGGTLLIVGHVHDHQHHDHQRGDQLEHPESASVTLKGITNAFSLPEWQIDRAYERTRTVHPGGTPVQLRDVIVRTRRIA